MRRIRKDCDSERLAVGRDRLGGNPPAPLVLLPEFPFLDLPHILHHKVNYLLVPFGVLVLVAVALENLETA